MSSLAGKRVWITGAGKGIGRAVALELASRGAVCGLTARDEKSLNEVLQQIEKRGGKAFVLPGDVTDADRMKAIAAELQAKLGGIDILLSNAGTHVFTKPEQFDANEYISLMNLNFGGMARCIEAVLPDMLNCGNGHLVATASMAGYRGIPRAGAYCASKAAIIHFLESIRFHLILRGVKVTVINPGFVRTPLTDKNVFHMPFLIEPDKAARIICNGIEREKEEIAFPFPVKWGMKFLRIVPYPIWKAVMFMAWKR